MKKLFKLDFVLFVFFLILTSSGVICKNHISTNFFSNFVADSWGNIWGTVTASFLFFSLKKEILFRRRELIIVAVGTGFIIYEFIQFILPWQTFDLKDIGGTLIGILLSTIINSMVVFIRWIYEKSLRIHDPFNGISLHGLQADVLPEKENLNIQKPQPK